MLSKLLSFLLLVPMISHWVLPSGIEGKLYMAIAYDMVFYIPNVCYILYVLLYLSVSHKSNIPFKLRHKLGLILLLIFVYAFIHSIIKNPTPEAALFNDLNYCYFAILFILFPLSPREIQYTKWPLILTLVFLSSEVIIYSLGIMTYTGINDRNVQDFGGVARIATTIGAATGTAVILFLLASWCISIYNLKNHTIMLLILLSSFAIFFTVSRGSILAWSLFLIIYLYRKYFRHMKVSKRIRYVLGITAILTALFYVGLFNPLIERVEEKQDISSGRDERFEIVFSIIQKSQYSGVGLAQVYCDKSISSAMPRTYAAAPHNTYLTVLAEQGIIGLALFLLLFLTIILNSDKKHPLTIALYLLMIVTFNTEATTLHGEFMAPIMFTAMISLKKKPTIHSNEKSIIYNKQ